MDKEALLLKYFEGTLSAEEHEAFGALMKEDAAFREEVALEEDVQRVVRHREGAALKSKLKGFEAQLAKDQDKIVSKKPWNFLKIAASFAVLLAVSWFIYQWTATPVLDELYASNYEKFPNTVYTITRSDTLDNSPERKAFEAYEGDDMKAAIAYFEELLEVSNLDYIPFFLGQSYLKDGQTAQALQQFATIIKNDTDFKSEALWYSALAYLKKGDKSMANKQLQLLILEGNYKKAQAQELLESLD